MIFVWNNIMNLDETRKTLDEISSTFCAAKWLNSSIWLGTGMTASCHMPPAHKIDMDELENNPLAIHNTKEKNNFRQEMLKGVKVKECSACWDNEENNCISERFYKSQIYDKKTILSLPENSNPYPKTLEISFDRSCNMACLYCNSEFSTTWAKDIRDNGPYFALETEGSSCYTKTNDNMFVYSDDNNPFIKAFFNLCENGLVDNLDEIRITGGEPFMSPNFRRFFEKYKNKNIRIAINTNLCFQEKWWKWFLENIDNVNNLHLYMSNESFGAQGEYVRDGYNQRIWESRYRVLKEKSNVTLHAMCTINALTMDTGFEEFLKWSIDNQNVNLTFNFLRFPQFLDVDNIPLDIKEKIAKSVLNIFESYKENNEFFNAQINRLVYNLSICKFSEEEVLKNRKDLKNFIIQYDRRRNKEFKKTFDKLIGFYDAIQR